MRFSMKMSVVILGVCALAGLPTILKFARAAQAQSTVPASVPYIEAHSHLNSKDVDGSMKAASAALPRENAAGIVFMPLPFGPEDKGIFDVELLLPSAKKYPGKIAVAGGGGSLNVMIQQAMRSGDTGPEVQRKFRERAEQILRDGAVGFGEMSAEHFDGVTGYHYAPADHPLYLILADVAAEHHVPISLHMEAVAQPMALPAELKSPPNAAELHENIAAFERLLAHNRQAPIIWAHAGSDFTGYREPVLLRRLLQANSNLYMEIKMDPLALRKNPPAADGVLKPEWRKLFEDFADRFIIGSDQHYGPGEDPFQGQQRWETVVRLLNQLPAEVRRKIGIENASRLYGFKIDAGR